MDTKAKMEQAKADEAKLRQEICKGKPSKRKRSKCNIDKIRTIETMSEQPEASWQIKNNQCNKKPAMADTTEAEQVDAEQAAAKKTRQTPLCKARQVTPTASESYADVWRRVGWRQHT